MRRLAIIGVAALTTAGLVGLSCSSDKTTPGTSAGGSANASTGGESSASTGGATSTGTTPAATGGSISPGNTEATGGSISPGNTEATGGAVSGSTGGTDTGSQGGAQATGGSAAAAGGTALGCQTSAAWADPNGLVADFTETTDAGGIAITGGGTFTYGGTAAPSISQGTGNMHVTINAAQTATTQYVGFGIYFDNCTDGTARTGIKFDISGTINANCTMQFGINIRDDSKNSDDKKASCTAASCYGPQTGIPGASIAAAPTTVSMPYTSVTGGSPVTVTAAMAPGYTQFMTGLLWQFTIKSAGDAGGNCTADINIDNVSFY